MNKTIKDFSKFIKNSPTSFHAVNTIALLLEKEGYQQLFENESFKLASSGKYYVIRNGSSIIAFNYDNPKQLGFNICASHSDSPAFKVKENAQLEVRNKYVQLNTEGYGGMLLAPWFDRPLSVAGRVLLNKKAGPVEALVNIDRDLLVIPNLAIHMNRKANEGMEYNKQIDLLPLYSDGQEKGDSFKNLIAKELGCKADEIIGSDLYLYNRSELSLLGAKEEYIGAPRLDDLECAYGSLMGFLKAGSSSAINVYACFDNEEVGSQSYQGAASTFLKDVLRRIMLSLNKNEEEYMMALANSFLISADNAHALHPNHPEKSDSGNTVFMNEGIVIKQNANQKYTSDAISIGKLKLLCEKAKVPYQCYANRSDIPGGSTLGNLLMSQVSIRSCDIGLAQLAMHSCYETAGAKDMDYLIALLNEFYS